MFDDIKFHQPRLEPATQSHKIFTLPTERSFGMSPEAKSLFRSPQASSYWLLGDYHLLMEAGVAIHPSCWLELERFKSALKWVRV